VDRSSRPPLRRASLLFSSSPPLFFFLDSFSARAELQFPDALLQCPWPAALHATELTWTVRCSLRSDRAGLFFLSPGTAPPFPPSMRQQQSRAPLSSLASAPSLVFAQDRRIFRHQGESCYAVDPPSSLGNSFGRLGSSFSFEDVAVTSSGGRVPALHVQDHPSDSLLPLASPSFLPRQR